MNATPTAGSAISTVIVFIVFVCMAIGLVGALVSIGKMSASKGDKEAADKAKKKAIIFACMFLIPMVIGWIAAQIPA